MSGITFIRVLRLPPLLSQSATLMFALDEHIFLGTWVHPELRQRANAHLPAWFARWGKRGTWVIKLGYPLTWTLTIFNLIARSDATLYFSLGLFFSGAHMFYGLRALALLADIRNDVPKGNVAHSMRIWLRLNYIRAWTTDFPAWLCFRAAALLSL